MVRKRKSATRKKRKGSKSHAIGSWGWLGTGLGIGLILGVGLYLYRSIPEQTITTRVADTPAPEPESPSQKTQKQAQTQPAPVSRKSHFDFYTLLPEIEVEITDEELEEALRILPKIDRSGIYVLQIGSFRNYGDADGLKARLALLGIVANIEKVVNKSGNTWHRVRVGPFTEIKIMKKARRQLKNNHIDYIMLKIKA